MKQSPTMNRVEIAYREFRESLGYISSPEILMGTRTGRTESQTSQACRIRAAKKRGPRKFYRRRFE